MKKLLLFAPVLLFAFTACMKDAVYVPTEEEKAAEEAAKQEENQKPGDETTPEVTGQTIFINEVNCGTKEFEIYNASDKEADITGYTFTKDGNDDWSVPANLGKIPAKGFVVYTAKQSDPAVGPAFGLSGTKGFKLTMYKDATKAEIVDEIDNSKDTEGFKEVPDGFTLSRTTDGGSTWEVIETGTIGSTNGVAPAPVIRLYINEVDCQNKKFEIYNGSSVEVDITGYTFTKDDNDDWSVPASLGKIPSKGFVVYTAKQSDPAVGPAFGISGTKGFKLIMYKDSTKGEVVDMIDNSKDTEGFKEVPDGTSLGRKTDGADEWVLFSTPSIGETNANGTVSE